METVKLGPTIDELIRELSAADSIEVERENEIAKWNRLHPSHPIQAATKSANTMPAKDLPLHAAKNMPPRTTGKSVGKSGQGLKESIPEAPPVPGVYYAFDENLPEGMTVAYIVSEKFLDDKILIIKDGSVTPMRMGEHSIETVCLSPDEDLIAYGSFYNIAILSISGKKVGELTNAHNVIFSPGGNQIAYVGRRGGIFVAGYDGGNVRCVRETVPGVAICDWKGDKLLFKGHNGSFLINVKTGGSVDINFPSAHPNRFRLANRGHHDMQLSPDADKVYYFGNPPGTIVELSVSDGRARTILTGHLEPLWYMRSSLNGRFLGYYCMNHRSIEILDIHTGKYGDVGVLKPKVLKPQEGDVLEMINARGPFDIK